MLIPEPLDVLVFTFFAITSIFILAPLLASIAISFVFITDSLFTLLPLEAFNSLRFSIVTCTFFAFDFQMFFFVYIFKTPSFTSVIMRLCKFSSASTVIAFVLPWRIKRSIPVLTFIPEKSACGVRSVITIFLFPSTQLNTVIPQEVKIVVINRIPKN